MSCSQLSRSPWRPRQHRQQHEARQIEDVPAGEIDPGKARSWAPIIIGIKKLPSVVGIDGIRKNHTMTTPCMVNMRLYIEGCSKPAGVARCSRIRVAAKPPTKKKNVIDAKNSSAMRLWSLVSSQEPIVFSRGQIIGSGVRRRSSSLRVLWEGLADLASDWI